MSREQYKHAAPILSSAAPTGDHVIHGFAIYNGSSNGTGSIGVRTYGGTDVQFTNVPAGAIVPHFNLRLLLIILV